MNYWLVKSEPTTYSIADLEGEGSTLWNGVRNYQARNYLKAMQKGEKVLFYHSSTDPVGVAGVCQVLQEALPDPSQFDAKSEYFDPSSSAQEPRWYCPKLKFIEKFDPVLGLEKIRVLKGVSKMHLLRQGSRLSVQPVSESEFEIIVKAARQK